MSWLKLKDTPNKRVLDRDIDRIILWKIDKDKIYHQNREIKKADIETFEVLEQNLFFARDRYSIYYAWNLLKADRDSFKALVDSYFIDKEAVYFELETSVKVLKEADSKTFLTLEKGFAKDKNRAYYYGRVIKPCRSSESFKVIKADEKVTDFAKDSENIYFQKDILKKADLKSWTLFNNYFSFDNSSVFYCSYKLPYVDVDSWKYLGYNYSIDKKNIYYLNRRLTTKKPIDIEHILTIFKLFKQ